MFVTLLAVASSAAILLAPALWIRHLRLSARAEALAGAGGDHVVLEDTLANSLGRASSGAGQVRGNGALVLTRTGLSFVQWIPRRSLHIPLTRIVRVESTRSHLGKSMSRELVRVVFTGEDGAEDSIAWAVRGPDRWRTELEGLCQP